MWILQFIMVALQDIYSQFLVFQMQKAWNTLFKKLIQPWELYTIVSYMGEVALLQMTAKVYHVITNLTVHWMCLELKSNIHN
jgi:hypothetical protein